MEKITIDHRDNMAIIALSDTDLDLLPDVGKNKICLVIQQRDENRTFCIDMRPGNAVYLKKALKHALKLADM